MIGLVQIPSTSEAEDTKGIYTIFNIHVNGCYHGSVRYSQLLAFHQELKAKFNISSLEEFPGKHWFGSLSPDQLFVRRVGLERYLHSVCQDRTIGTGNMLKEYFIAIQKASTDVTDPSGEVEVFLVNSKSVTVKVGTFDRTDEVLEKVCSEIKLAPKLTYYFGLFLEHEQDDTWMVDRPLTDFECPCLTLREINKAPNKHRVTIRKTFWDPVFIPELVEDKVAKNLLYIETLACVTLAQWEVPPDTFKKLAALQKKGQKKEYLELAGTLVQFGFTQMAGITLDHPTDDMTGFVRVGKLDIISYSSEDAEAAEKIFTYPLTKIRSWKLGGKLGSPWLKFFFQLGASDFVPVSVLGAQTILMSYCLHSVVDELLRVRSKQPIRQPQEIVREPLEMPKIVFYEAPVPIVPDDATPTEDTTPTEQDKAEEAKDTVKPKKKTATTEAAATPTTTPSKDQTDGASNNPKQDHAPKPDHTSKSDHTHKESPAAKDRPEVTTKRLASVSSTGEPEKKVKTPKKKLLPSVSDIENPTFQFGTDDDL